MTAAAATRFDPVFGAQAVFRIVLDAMARPGTRTALPAIDPVRPIPDLAAVAAVGQTLLDHEVTFAVVPAPSDGAVADRFAAYLALTTGCRLVSAPEADYVIALGQLPAGLPATLRPGVPTYPDEGATLICHVPNFDPATGTDVALAGPGVRPGTTLTLPGLTPADLASLAAANAEPPCGIDLILIDPIGSVVALPRSTRLTLHEARRREGDEARS